MQFKMSSSMLQNKRMNFANQLAVDNPHITHETTIPRYDFIIHLPKIFPDIHAGFTFVGNEYHEDQP